MSWLPADFVHPIRIELGTGHHLRPIRAGDVDLDYPAVMGSRERLWSMFGMPWGWPPADMSYEDDHADLARHEREIESHESFNYAVFDADETALLGCVYVDPPERVGADAEISWWLVDPLVGTEVERHDTIGGACSKESNTLRYGHHTAADHACRENFLYEGAKWGLGARDLVSNLNWFMNVPVEADGSLGIVDGMSAPGKRVAVRAERDVLVVVSNCPQMNNPCNAFDPTPLRMIVTVPGAAEESA